MWTQEINILENTLTCLVIAPCSIATFTSISTTNSPGAWCTGAITAWSTPSSLAHTGSKLRVTCSISMYTGWTVLITIYTIFPWPAGSIAVSTMPSTLTYTFSCLKVAWSIVLAVTFLNARFSIVPTWTVWLTTDTWKHKVKYKI